MTEFSFSVRKREGRMSGEAVAALNVALAARFGNRFTASDAVRKTHGHTLTWLENQPPDAVVFAETKDDVIDAVKLCAAHDAPITPFGTGTSLEGHVNAPHGGLSLDCSRMNAVLAVNAEDLDCVVEPGVTRKQLNEHLRATGLFFPIDPGADASLGGMAATRASGTNAVRYGTMKDLVLSLGIVTADGSFLRTGSRAKKSSAGYDLTHLFIGAEGTLGVIVEIALRLFGVPEAISAGTLLVSRRALRLRRNDRDHPVGLADRPHRASRRAFGPRLQRLCETDAARAADAAGRIPRNRAKRRRAGAPLRRNRRRPSAAAISSGRPGRKTAPRLWQARHDVFWALTALGRARAPFATDACVPISRLADCVEETLADIASSGLIAPIVGHVGDGNFHVSPLIDMNNRAEIEAADAFAGRLAHRAIAMGGTCTGEHGVGQKKMAYMEEEHGPAALDLMRRVKASFDPTKSVQSREGRLPPEGRRARGGGDWPQNPGGTFRFAVLTGVITKK